jgi:hypothetical protein
MSVLEFGYNRPGKLSIDIPDEVYEICEDSQSYLRLKASLADKVKWVRLSRSTHDTRLLSFDLRFLGYQSNDKLDDIVEICRTTVFATETEQFGRLIPYISPKQADNLLVAGNLQWPVGIEDSMVERAAFDVMQEVANYLRPPSNTGIPATNIYNFVSQTKGTDLLIAEDETYTCFKTYDDFVPKSEFVELISDPLRSVRQLAKPTTIC